MEAKTGINTFALGLAHDSIKDFYKQASLVRERLDGLLDKSEKIDQALSESGEYFVPTKLELAEIGRTKIINHLSSAFSALEGLMKLLDALIRSEVQKNPDIDKGVSDNDVLTAKKIAKELSSDELAANGYSADFNEAVARVSHLADNFFSIDGASSKLLETLISSLETFDVRMQGGENAEKYHNLVAGATAQAKELLGGDAESSNDPSFSKSAANARVVAQTIKGSNINLDGECALPRSLSEAQDQTGPIYQGQELNYGGVGKLIKLLSVFYPSHLFANLNKITEEQQASTSPGYKYG